MKEWARLGAVVPTLLLVPAVLGATALPRLLAPLFVLLVILDGATWPRQTILRPSWSPAPPAGLLEVIATLPEGPLITLPVERSLMGEIPVPRSMQALWARVHGRPISASYTGREDALLRAHGLVQGAEYAGAVGLGLVPAAAIDRGCMSTDAAALAREGWAAVVVVGADPRAAAEAALLAEALGPATAAEGHAHGWALTRGWGSACSLELPPVGPADPTQRSPHPATRE